MTTQPVLGDVAPDYVHRDKVTSPSAQLDLPGARFKWYDVQLGVEPIGESVREGARDFLAAEVAAGRFEVSGDLGFVVLHECSNGFHYLLVNTWRNENELWETVYGTEGDSYALVPFSTHRPVFCVWELGPVGHERSAWIRYLRSPRDDDARETYLADLFSGEV